MALPPPSPVRDMEDKFDGMHDSVILHILNRVEDIKVLGRCRVVSKRFRWLVSLVENVTVKVDCVISGDDAGLNVTASGMFGHLIRFVVGSLVKPLQVLQHMLDPKKPIHAEVSHHSPGEVLKNFTAVKHLKIELPEGELGVEDGVILKWKAEFGSTLESCAILGASGLVNAGNSTYKKSFSFCGRYGELHGAELGDAAALSCQDDTGNLPESFYTNGGLKLRVVWTISSLIAASARHYLLRQIISDHPTLMSLMLTDADGQGMLQMGQEQLKQFRLKPLAASASANRTQVPALDIKLWYAPYLELPDEFGMKGATLVAIQPSDQPSQREMDGFISGAFDEPFKMAVNLLAKRRTYHMEMNSF